MKRQLHEISFSEKLYTTPKKNYVFLGYAKQSFVRNQLFVDRNLLCGKFIYMIDYIRCMRTLTNQRALDFLKVYDIPTLDYTHVHDAHHISKFPCVLKIDSTKIIHKSEKSGVQIIHHAEHAQKHFPKLRKKGHVISQQHADGHEFVMQVVKPPKGKSLIMLGLAGVPIDVHDHFSVRTCPISLASAKKMIQELRGAEYVAEFNNKKSKLSYLEKTLVSLSKLAVREDFRSLEIDPFIVNHKFGGVVDAKIVL